MVKKFIWVFLFFMFFISSVSGATYYISPDGLDSNPGTFSQPWATFVHAIGSIVGGDTLILKDGVYEQRIGQYVSGAPYNSYSLPSGSDGAYTILKAENDGMAIIQNGGIWLGGAVNGGVPVGSSYIQIEGLKLRGSNINIRGSYHIKVLRTGVKNGVAPDSRYGSVISISGDSHHVLLEDVWVIGSMRYGINVFESYNVILRRVVARFDGNTEREPKSGFCFYGADDSQGITGAYDSMCQNCIAIDYNKGADAGIKSDHAGININI